MHTIEYNIVLKKMKLKEGKKGEWLNEWEKERWKQEVGLRWKDCQGTLVDLKNQITIKKSSYRNLSMMPFVC